MKKKLHFAFDQRHKQEFTMSIWIQRGNKRVDGWKIPGSYLKVVAFRKVIQMRFPGNYARQQKSMSAKLADKS